VIVSVGGSGIGFGGDFDGNFLPCWMGGESDDRRLFFVMVRWI